jgi:hypothetical protein
LYQLIYLGYHFIRKMYMSVNRPFKINKDPKARVSTMTIVNVTKTF